MKPNKSNKLIIESQTNLLAFQNLSKNKVSEMVINFVTSNIPAEKRAEILYWFKEVAKQIELMDRAKQIYALERIFNQSKEEKFGKVSINGFDIIKKDISEYEYPIDIQIKIDEYEANLKDAKEYFKDSRILIKEKYTYYLKHKGELK